MEKTDEFLLKRIKENDQKAFKDLFYRYVDDLERFINWHIDDREKSQEFVLDIFTYIWEKREPFEIRYQLKSYLFQAGRNKAFTYIKNRKITIYLEDILISESTDDTVTILELEELSELIEEAVSILPGKCREIFINSRQHDKTNKEIAAQFELTEKTIENQITIAIKKIKTHLKRYHYLVLIFLLNS